MTAPTLVRAAAGEPKRRPCPPWCDGWCLDPATANGLAVHIAAPTEFQIIPCAPGASATVVVCASRSDRPGGIGRPLVSAEYPCGSVTRFTPDQARAAADALLSIANRVGGPHAVRVAALRLGDRILTGDGWQTVQGLMFFADTGQASVWTDKRDPETDGWQFDIADEVTVDRGQVAP